MIQAYFWSWIFWMGLSLGSVGLILLFELTGGHVREELRRELRAISQAAWVFAGFFLPIAGGLPGIFPWAGGSFVFSSPIERRYFETGFFLVRSAAYLVFWAGLIRWGQRRPARALILHVVVVTFAALDWMMSLDNQWSSTIFAWYWLVLQAVGAFSIALMMKATQSRGSRSPVLARQRDFGNLLLTLTMSATYLGLMQFLVIWSADIPRESAWYLTRLDRGWLIPLLLSLLLGWVMPLGMLLFRKNKENPEILRLVAFISLAATAVHIYWLLVPKFHGALPRFSDVLCFAGLGLVWLGIVRGRYHAEI